MCIAWCISEISTAIATTARTSAARVWQVCGKCVSAGFRGPMQCRQKCILGGKKPCYATHLQQGNANQELVGVPSCLQHLHFPFASICKPSCLGKREEGRGKRRLMSCLHQPRKKETDPSSYSSCSREHLLWACSETPKQQQQQLPPYSHSYRNWSD